MHITFSPTLVKELQRLKRTDKKLAAKTEKQLRIFKLNPKHPSLRTHKLTGKKQDAWSISITMSIRMIYVLVDKETAYFTHLGTHEEVYGK